MAFCHSILALTTASHRQDSLLPCETVPVVEVFGVNVYAVINDDSVYRYYIYSSYRHPNLGGILPHEGDRSFIDVMLT